MPNFGMCKAEGQTCSEYVSWSCRFLDTRMFATCSDDHTVNLWDLRNMSHRVCLLRGHSDMVKNVEFIPSKGIILTSAFDGNINTWDINWYVV